MFSFDYLFRMLEVRAMCAMVWQRAAHAGTNSAMRYKVFVNYSRNCLPSP